MAGPNPFIGRTVAGRFKITRVLGEGGMATVFVAEQDGDPREVALKIMNEELTRDKTFVRRFEREAKAASLVVHANSVKIFACGVDGKLSYIAMEVLTGDDLYVLLERGGPMSQARAARILAEVCDALEVAHGLGIVHRDLKPENIMVMPDPAGPGGERVKVLDFGIAKLLAPDVVVPPVKSKRPDSNPDSKLTQAGTLIGTPAYMSPEQCGLQQIDARSDIYTCGVLLFQLLTGRLPFEGETPLHTAMLHIHEPPRKPSELAPELDPRFEAIILKALEKKPTDRFARASLLATELRAILPTLPDKPAAPSPKTKRPISNRSPRQPALPQNGRFVETLRWSGEAGDVPALESARTLVADGQAVPPPSVRLNSQSKPHSSEPTTPRKPPPRPAAGMPPRPAVKPPPSQEAPSSDPADRAKTLIREAEEPMLEPLRRRAGPLGTEVIHIPPAEPSPQPRRREAKPTLRSADGFQGDASAASSRAPDVRVIADSPSTIDDVQGAVDEATRDATTMPRPPDVELQLATLPMGVQRPMPSDIGFGRTLPASQPRGPSHAATLELTQQPRIIEPFRFAVPAREPGGGLGQMSGARVLLLGFLAGAVLMAVVCVVYLFVLR